MRALEPKWQAVFARLKLAPKPGLEAGRRRRRSTPRVNVDGPVPFASLRNHERPLILGIYGGNHHSRDSSVANFYQLFCGEGSITEYPYSNLFTGGPSQVNIGTP